MRIADQNYYLDDKGNVVTEDDPNQAFQLVGKGCEITKEMVERYGDFDKVTQKGEKAVAEVDSSESPVEEKTAAKPSANKSKKPTENKGVK